METLSPHAYYALAIFVIGYIGIIFELNLKINKSVLALFLGTLSWMALFTERDLSVDRHLYILSEQMFKVSQVLFFLIGALIIVETINMHRGFEFITQFLNVRSKRQFLWSIGFITFFTSAVLDNLTTTIIMYTLARKLLESRQERMMLGTAIVVAANAGGAWTPIGDIATTVIWINDKVQTVPLIAHLFLPSLICAITYLALISPLFKGPLTCQAGQSEKKEPYSKEILMLGIALLLFVPILKVSTDLPAYMGMMLSVAILWLATDKLHAQIAERSHLNVANILPKVDMTIFLFYFGLLLGVNALESAGLLREMALWLNQHITDPDIMAISIGLFSSVIDNVSLVMACIGMYGKDSSIPTHFWELLAYCSGTGGSTLIIGSAAGLVLMSLDKVDFMWYAKNAALRILASYFAGIAAYYAFMSVF